MMPPGLLVLTTSFSSFCLHVVFKFTVGGGVNFLLMFHVNETQK